MNVHIKFGFTQAMQSESHLVLCCQSSKHSRVGVVVMCVWSEDVQWHQHGDLYTFFKRFFLTIYKVWKQIIRPFSF
jgi:hypothetical protein